ncbi:MAG: S-methyl-5'-thioinosine phosphorylase [Pseudomonadales bacterium]|nr:S-methyl-5'-thioinosine phosphorylase [Pseudomonadales bacterium]
MASLLAVIGGTGFGEFVGLEGATHASLDTAWGSVDVQFGELDGVQVVFLPRHGMPPSTPPHRINYRAHVQALVDAGADAVIAVTAVGSVDPTLGVPSVVVPDQVIDYTWGRAHTFFDGEIHHIDFTFPYDETWRSRLVAAAQAVRSTEEGMLFRETGVYGCTQGPRLETAAEIARMGRDGCHIVGMTAMPEVALARERELPYAGISVVVNHGAGIGGQVVHLDEIEAAMSKGMGWVRAILRRAFSDYSAGPGL